MLPEHELGAIPYGLASTGSTARRVEEADGAAGLSMRTEGTAGLSVRTEGTAPSRRISVGCSHQQYWVGCIGLNKIHE